MNRETRRKQQEELTLEDLDLEVEQRKQEVEQFEMLADLLKPTGMIHRIRRVREQDGLGYTTKYILESTRHITDLDISEASHLLDRRGESNDEIFYETGRIVLLNEQYNLEYAEDYEQTDAVKKDEEINIKQLVASKIV